MNNKFLRYIKYFFVMLLIVAAFFLGCACTGSQNYVRDLSSTLSFWQGEGDILKDVNNKIKTEYLGEVDNQKLYYGMARGLVKSLDDPYSEFFDPEEAKVFWDDLGGEFEGIGVEIVLESGKVKILTVLDNSPAKEAGLQVGDVILAVNDNDVIDKSLGEIANLIKGEDGSQVTLMILRDDEVLDIKTERRKIVADSVYVTEDNDVVNVRITRFDENTDQEFISKMKDIDVAQKKGVIIDVRGNPGGYFDSAVRLADKFLADGIIVTESNDKQINEQYKAKAGDEYESVKLVVLIDRASASAAEILAGAIKDNHRGQVVGEESYGKGSVQVVEKLSDGSALKLTIAEWLTPSGVNLRKQGIKPDVAVEYADNQDDVQYNNAKELLLSE